MPSSRLHALALLVFTTVHSTAQAQSCHTPMLIMPADGVPLAATTCGQADSLPAIGFLWISPQPDYVMTFTAVPGLVGYFDVRAQFDAAYALLPACSESAEPLDAGMIGQARIPLDGLSPGDYFVVVTGSPVSQPDACGEFTLAPVVVVRDGMY